MDETLHLGGTDYRVEYDPSHAEGVVRVTRDRSPVTTTYGFRHVLGEPGFHWNDPPPDRDVAAHAGSLAAMLQARERLGCVRVQPYGWAECVEPHTRRAVARTWVRGELCHDGHAYPLPGLEAMLQRLRLDPQAPPLDAVVVYELRGADAFHAERAHPTGRSTRLGLNRRLYGELYVVALRGDDPVTMPRALQREVAGVLNALPPDERVLQHLRYAAQLRAQRSASWPEVELALHRLAGALDEYEATLQGTPAEKAGPKVPKDV